MANPMKNVLAFGLALLLTAPGVALAQDAQKATLAASLFEEAQKDMAAKNYAEACPKLERVVELIPDGVGAKMELASCYEGAGRLATAYGAYVSAEGAAIRANQADRAGKARERMDALKPRLATVNLQVPEEVRKAPGFALKRDGSDVSSAEFGLSIPIDKGEHTLIATANGKPAWEKKFSINDGEKQTIKVELGTDGATPPPEDPKTGPNDPKTTPPGGEPAKPTGETNFFSPLRIAGLGIGIGGLAVFGAGVGLGMHAKSVYDDSNETGGCDAETNVCSSQTGVDMRSDAVTFATASTALIVIGGIMTAGGVVLFAVAPSEEVNVAFAPGFVTVTSQF